MLHATSANSFYNYRDLTRHFRISAIHHDKVIANARSTENKFILFIGMVDCLWTGNTSNMIHLLRWRSLRPINVIIIILFIIIKHVPSHLGWLLHSISTRRLNEYQLPVWVVNGGNGECGHYSWKFRWTRDPSRLALSKGRQPPSTGMQSSTKLVELLQWLSHEDCINHKHCHVYYYCY